MKIWIDHIKPAPLGYIWCKTVEEAKQLIMQMEMSYGAATLIDIDHDAGEYAKYGGNYIKLLDWLEGTRRNYLIHIHSMNPIGMQNMRRIIQRNRWKEV